MIRAGAGDHHGAGAQVRQHRLNRGAGPAAAQNQHLFAGEIRPTFSHHGGKAVVVGVVAVDAVGLAHQGVHRPNALGLRGNVGAEFHHRFFVRNGDVDGIPGAVSQEIFQSLGGDFKQFVGIVSQMPVNLGGVAVAQVLPQQAAAHHTTSE